MMALPVALGKRSRPKNRPAPCPDCGATLALAGRFCRGCGWDADLVGSPDSHLDGVDLPRGYGPGDEESVPRSRGVRLFWWCVAVFALASFVLSMRHR